jgi:hypothetical protein
MTKASILAGLRLLLATARLGLGVVGKAWEFGRITFLILGAQSSGSAYFTLSVLKAMTCIGKRLAVLVEQAFKRRRCVTHQLGITLFCFRYNTSNSQ